MSGLTVRGAGPGDRDAIQAVTLAAYQEYTATIGAHWTGYRQNIIATLAAAAPGTQIVALEDDRVVGAVLLYPAGAAIQKPDGTTADPHVAGGALARRRAVGAGAWRRRRPHERVHSPGAERRGDGVDAAHHRAHAGGHAAVRSGSASSAPRSSISSRRPASSRRGIAWISRSDRIPRVPPREEPDAATGFLSDHRHRQARRVPRLLRAVLRSRGGLRGELVRLDDGGQWRARELRLHAPGASVGATRPRALRRQGHVPRVPGRGRGGRARAVSCETAPR